MSGVGGALTHVVSEMAEAARFASKNRIVGLVILAKAKGRVARVGESEAPTASDSGTGAISSERRELALDYLR